MGEPGDPAAQSPEPPASPREDEQPMIQHDQSPAAEADAILDEAAPEDATTQIVPQAQLAPPPDTPSSSSPGGPSNQANPANAPLPPQPQAQPGAGQWQGQ